MRDQARLLEEAKALNSKVFSLPRLQLMGLLAFFHPEGVLFRELQAQLDMGDGALLSNIYALRDLGYIKSQEAKVDEKMLTTYTITDEGLEAWNQTRAWLEGWLKSTWQT